MKIQDRLYYCPVCNTDSTHQTNHEGEIYVTCKVCKAQVLYFKGGELGEYIETKIHGYRFNIDNPDEREAYLNLKDSLDGRKCFNITHEPGATDLKILGQQDTVKLYTRQIFNNQWISNFGRLHDWFESIYPNKKIKEGYYLDITPEMETLRMPRPIIISTIYNGDILGTDSFMGINKANAINAAFDKYWKEGMDINKYKNIFPA